MISPLQIRHVDRRRPTIGIVCLILFLLGLFRSVAVADSRRPPRGTPRVPLQILIDLGPQTTHRRSARAAFSGLLKSVKARHPYKILREDLLNGRVLLLEIQPRPGETIDEEDEADDLLKRLNAVSPGSVLHAGPNYIVRPASATSPTDPAYQNGTQWHLHKINAPTAWAITADASSVIVADIDAGVQSDHPDLKANMISGWNINHSNTDTSPTSSTATGGQHGTAVVGALGAVGDNGIGVTGVAQKVKIMPVRMTDKADGSATTTAAGLAIQWAADHGARVINYSYTTADCYWYIEQEAEYAYGKGVLMVAAAGDSKQLISTPCNGMMYVGGTDKNDTQAVWSIGTSAYGPAVDLFAPGSLIYTTQPTNAYQYWQGTSLAAPLVSGTAALLFALHPAFTVDQVRYFLNSTADRTGALANSSIYGHGRLDAGAALAAAKASLGAQPVVTLTKTVQVNGNTTATVARSGDTVTYVLSFDNSRGTAAASSVAINDTLPKDVTYVNGSASTSVNNMTITPQLTTDANGRVSALKWTIPTIGFGGDTAAKGSLRFSATVN